MSAFSGPQGKGAMRKRREEKRAEAVARNLKANATRRLCGHVHGEGLSCQAAS